MGGRRLRDAASPQSPHPHHTSSSGGEDGTGSGGRRHSGSRFTLTQTQEPPRDSKDTMRILIATDNHLGFDEKDSVRGHDSFLAFEEILQTARDRKVDCVVLGGDLFHDNKPSRSTLVRCMRLLREHALGNGEGGDGGGVRIQVLNDAGMEESIGAVAPEINFKRAGSRVKMPIFAIHGNHDDPTGPEQLSVMDVLAEANLLTYFGKYDLEAEGPGRVQVSPIILSKGSARLALYGLGYIRDERLNRMFDTPGSVRFVKPEGVTPSCSDSSECFNLFMIHQTKQRVAASKNYVSPHHLPQFLDLVCWGHEHECLITPQPAAEAGDKFLISQPGSSVVTSLIEGEAGRKKIMILSVRNDEYHTEEITLSSTRPFAYRAIKLSKTPGLDPDDMELVEEFLHENVDELIEKAAKQEVPTELLRLPLVRIRVDYTGFSTINTQRFGQKYVGRVANPSDIIAFHKESRRSKQGPDADAAGVPGVNDDGAVMRPDAQMDHAKIDRLIRANLKSHTKILPISDLSVAVSDYVEKEEKAAIETFVKKALEDAKRVIEKPTTAAPEVSGDGEEPIEVIDEEFIEKKVLEYVKTKDGDMGSVAMASVDLVPDSAEKDAGHSPVEGALAGGSSLKRKAGTVRKSKVSDEDDSDYEEEEPRKRSRTATKAKAKAATSRKPAQRGRGRKIQQAQPPSSSDGESEEEAVRFSVDGSDEEYQTSGSDGSYRGTSAQGRGKKKAPASRQKATRGAQRRGSQRAKPARRATKPSVIEDLISSDED